MTTSEQAALLAKHHGDKYGYCVACYELCDCSEGPSLAYFPCDVHRMAELKDAEIAEHVLRADNLRAELRRLEEELEMADEYSELEIAALTAELAQYRAYHLQRVGGLGVELDTARAEIERLREQIAICDYFAHRQRTISSGGEWKFCPLCGESLKARKASDRQNQ